MKQTPLTPEENVSSSKIKTADLWDSLNFHFRNSHAMSRTLLNYLRNVLKENFKFFQSKDFQCSDIRYFQKNFNKKLKIFRK